MSASVAGRNWNLICDMIRIIKDDRERNNKLMSRTILNEQTSAKGTLNLLNCP